MATQGGREHVKGRLLLIVAREAPARLTYFKRVYGNDTVEVIADRRVSQRRRRRELVASEWRRVERRRRDVAEDLRTFGWTLVRH